LAEMKPTVSVQILVDADNLDPVEQT